MLRLRAVLFHGGNNRGFQGPPFWDELPRSGQLLSGVGRVLEHPAPPAAPTSCPHPRTLHLCSHSCDYAMIYGRADLKTGRLDQWASSNHTNLKNGGGRQGDGKHNGPLRVWRWRGTCKKECEQPSGAEGEATSWQPARNQMNLEIDSSPEPP